MKITSIEIGKHRGQGTKKGDRVNFGSESKDGSNSIRYSVDLEPNEKHYEVEEKLYDMARKYLNFAEGADSPSTPFVPIESAPPTKTMQLPPNPLPHPAPSQDPLKCYKCQNPIIGSPYEWDDKNFCSIPCVTMQKAMSDESKARVPMKRTQGPNPPPAPVDKTKIMCEKWMIDQIAEMCNANPKRAEVLNKYLKDNCGIADGRCDHMTYAEAEWMILQLPKCKE